MPLLLFVMAVTRAQNHTDFVAIPMPSPHVLEGVVQFGQDQQGQIWLVTEQGISVFRELQFVPFRAFDFPEPIISAAFLPNHLVLATSKRVVAIALASPQAPEQLLWQYQEAGDGQSGLAVALSQSKAEEKSALYLQTEQALYELDLSYLDKPATTQLTTTQQVKPQLLVRFEQVPKKLLETEHGLYLLYQDSMDFYHSMDRSWQSERLPLGTTDAVVTDNEVVILNNEGQVHGYNLFAMESRTKRELGHSDVSAFSGSYPNWYVRKGKSLQQLDIPTIEVSEGNLASIVFADSNNNLWLSTPFDIQVAWWQPLAVEKVAKPRWGDFFSSSLLSDDNRYGVNGRNLYQAAGADLASWQRVWRVPEELPLPKTLLASQNHLWLQFPELLLLLDKNTLTTSHSWPLSDGDILLPYDGQSVLHLSKDQILQHNVSGRTRVVKSTEQSLDQCAAKCLPSFRVNDALAVPGGVYLATNQGLHFYDYSTATVSDTRLDVLNQLSPLITVQPALDGQLWLVYPTKIALFSLQEQTSKIYYSDLNRIFDARRVSTGALVFNSQRGWMQVSPETFEAAYPEANLVVQQVAEINGSTTLSAVQEKLVIADNQEELRLAFNIGKQHPSQSLSVRFRYQDEENWSQVSMFNRSLTLKNLRQGANTLMLEARLEGQDWQYEKSISYILPYRLFQTKWVLVFIAVFLLALLGVVAHERFGRIKVVFQSLRQQAFISSLLESTKDGIWIADKDREITSVNQAFCDITGYELVDVQGRSFQLQTDFGRNHEVESLIWQEVIKCGFWSGEVWTKKADGEKLSIDLSVTRVETENRLLGKTDVKFVGVFSDVTARKKSERDLRQLATRDPLTNLANRTLFIEHIQQAVNTISAINPHFAVMFIDLDNFKKVNESLGPIKGDELIKLVAKRIENSVTKGVSLARLGGDEFALLIPNHLFSGVPAFYIKRVVTDIQRELQPAFVVDATEINITASMGVSIYPNHGDTPETLMRCADTALNRVKITGRNNCLIYDHVMDDMSDDKLSLESELISAINNDEFLVYYQPKYQMKQNEVSGWEALVRWQNPNRGLVPPDQFISIAEDNGLIRQLDFSVVRQVCRQIKEWREQELLKGKVAVNISALNFQQAEFCSSLIQLVEEEGNPIEYIELEITETAMMRDPERALNTVNTLRSKGFSIALDDFGTGHSSLGYLKRFPIDRIKIDRTFVKDIEFSVQDRNITSVIVQLAKHLNIEVIAEGVETETQAYLLHVMGCNEVQGYFISRPLSSDQVMQFVTVDVRKLQHQHTDG